MTVRTIRPSDIPVLKAMAEASGHPYPEINTGKLEAMLVVAGDDDKPLMAAAAERIVQIYLWCGEFERPHAKLHALRLLHGAMETALIRNGYTEANAFLPPTLAKRFARRLERTFGWSANWKSWTRRLNGSRVD